MARLTVLGIVPLSLVVLAATASPTAASVITTGDVDPGGAATQPDPWAVGGILKVGYLGDGTLNVGAGGVVANTYGFIGSHSGSTGAVIVTGTGSQWNNLDTLVGLLGDGTLNVEAGGVVSNTDGYIGRDSGSTSEATVTGPGSQWTNSNSLYIRWK